MSKQSLRNQADRAEAIADQTVDDELKKTLREAARDYRAEAVKEEFAPKAEWKLPREVS
jgi:hypothetical protein